MSGKKDSELVSYPSSKIVSWNVSAGHEEAAFVLCEDGSVWSYFYNAFHPSGFRLLVAAEPKKETEHVEKLKDSLGTALSLIYRLVTDRDKKSFDDANAFLNKPCSEIGV